MAITILSEFSETKDTLTSAALSVFMKPVLYFKVSGDAARLNPTAEIDITNTDSEGSDTITLQCIFEKTVSSEHYFISDLSEVMKHAIKPFTPFPINDALRFTDTEGQTEDYYGERQVDIDIYYERNEVHEQTDTETNDWYYLAEQIPNELGFNIWNLLYNRKFVDMKWGNDTYNALFMFFHTGGSNYVYNRTTGKTISGPFTPAGTARHYQVKFKKRIQEVYTRNRNWQVDDIDSIAERGLDTITPSVTNGIEQAELRVKKTVFSDDQTTTGGTTVRINYTDLSDDSAFIPDNQDDNIRNINPKQSTDEAKSVSTIEFVPLSYVATGASRHINAENVRALIEYNENEYDSVLEPGENVIEILTPDVSTVINIDYDPYCENYINLCWQHPELAYVSYPFDGVIFEGREIQKGIEIQKFITGLKSDDLTYNNNPVNTLNTVAGYDTRRKFTVWTTAEKKYLSMLKEIYSARHVYLFVGEYGDEDNQESWVEVQPSGSPNINEERNKVRISVDLLLPEHFNVKF